MEFGLIIGLVNYVTKVFDYIMGSLKRVREVQNSRGKGDFIRFDMTV